jgi:hypothetical protein
MYGQAAQLPKPKEWVCPLCSTRNFAHRYKCVGCAQPRPAAEGAAEAAAGGADDFRASLDKAIDASNVGSKMLERYGWQVRLHLTLLAGAWEAWRGGE